MAKINGYCFPILNLEKYRENIIRSWSLNYYFASQFHIKNKIYYEIVEVPLSQINV
jgi:hypothetical protein